MVAENDILLLDVLRDDEERANYIPYFYIIRYQDRTLGSISNILRQVLAVNNLNKLQVKHCSIQFLNSLLTLRTFGKNNYKYIIKRNIIVTKNYDTSASVTNVINAKRSGISCINDTGYTGICDHWGRAPYSNS